MIIHSFVYILLRTVDLYVCNTYTEPIFSLSHIGSTPEILAPFIIAWACVCASWWGMCRVAFPYIPRISADIKWFSVNLFPFPSACSTVAFLKVDDIVSSRVSLGLRWTWLLLQWKWPLWSSHIWQVPSRWWKTLIFYHKLIPGVCKYPAYVCFSSIGAH